MSSNRQNIFKVLDLHNPTDKLDVINIYRDLCLRNSKYTLSKY